MKVSFWLIPASPVKKDLAKLIAGMAEQFDGPVFTPHITLFSGDVSEECPVQRVLEETAVRFKPLLLGTQGIDFSDEFTRTLFIRFGINNDVAALAEKLRHAAANRSQFRFDPHLSLIYGTLPDDVKRNLALMIPPPPLMEFNAIAAIATGSQTRSRSDVEAWRWLGEATLKG